MESKYSKKYLIETGAGLQDVDNLKNSSYFKSETKRYIRGEITLEELEDIISSYYKNKPEEADRTEEADVIAVRIAKILSDDSFSFTVSQLISIHKQLFEGIYSHAGRFRTYNFIKKEWVLDGASVWYGDYRELEATLQYDFNVEKKFYYGGLSMDDILDHLATFIANLWQIHAFEEGNTRTTAVFVIKYMRSLGFDVTNDTFAKNAWYFRNALVRANYNNLSKGVYIDRSFLILFLRNLILHENNELQNRDLHIHASQIKAEGSREGRLLRLIRDNPKITIEELTFDLGVSERTVKNVLKSLEEEGLVKRVNGKKLGYWEVKKTEN